MQASELFFSDDFSRDKMMNYRCNGRPRLGSSSDAWQEAADADNVWRCTAP
ncbi:hypothetical protein PAHAL_9G482900 [Panicum hallii]|uniref:Uncharacterized protein n=1 Tax=Panicum hallii TaxID=206008 RepID=A0A2S3IRJ9_9POAL|nr:hypothetical protein PAHAL_9G482900 [Panicum hallii]